MSLTRSVIADMRCKVTLPSPINPAVLVLERIAASVVRGYSSRHESTGTATRRFSMKPVGALMAIAVLFVAATTSAQVSGGTAIIPSSQQVNAIYPEIEKLYADLHRNPELAFHEQRTAAELAERVKALGYDVTTGIGGTGIVAILKNGPGLAVMLRTELDALPIEEKTGLPFASAVKTKNAAGEAIPVMHAC